MGYASGVAIAVQSFLNEVGNTPMSYDSLREAVTGIDLDEVEGDISFEDDFAIASYLTHIGVSDSAIEDIMAGDEEISSSALSSIGILHEQTYTEEDLMALAEEYEGFYTYLDEISMDSARPHKCQSGYLKRMVIKNGKPDWKCVRISARKAVRTPAQKMAMRKAQLKSRTGLAKFHRQHSMRARKRRGMH